MRGLRHFRRHLEDRYQLPPSAWRVSSCNYGRKYAVSKSSAGSTYWLRWTVSSLNGTWTDTGVTSELITSPASPAAAALAISKQPISLLHHRSNVDVLRVGRNCAHDYCKLTEQVCWRDCQKVSPIFDTDIGLKRIADTDTDNID